MMIIYRMKFCQIIDCVERSKNGTAKPGPLSFSQDCFGLNMLAGIRERRQSALSPLQQRLALL